MSAKPPIFHPYTTNTGQVLLNDLVLYPHSAAVFSFQSDGTGVPVAPHQLTTESIDPEQGIILLVYPEVAIAIGLETLPVLPLANTLTVNTIILAADQYHLLQWPSSYFTPVPFDAVNANVYVSRLSAQNSTGDLYKLGNR